ncbi:MAG: transposase, partial [Sedimentisphaerales bacterium]|nr:transposase [Sedimentisphaerales bacterium]
VAKRNGHYRLEHTAKQRRLTARRREQETEVFRQRYKTRAGIEGTNSGLKRKTGLGQLRVRGGPAVFHAILLKVAGWNMLRAACCARMRQIVHERACRGILGQILAILRSRMTIQSVCIGRKTEITAYLQR